MLKRFHEQSSTDLSFWNTKLLQLGVLGLGLLQDGDVWVGIFPEGEEIYGFDSCRRTTSDSE